MTSDPRTELRAAWDELIANLERARDGIDHPELMPAPQNARNLAEGYRYLIGFVHHAIERAFHEDPVRPAFRNALFVALALAGFDIVSQCRLVLRGGYLQR